MLQFVALLLALLSPQWALAAGSCSAIFPAALQSSTGSNVFLVNHACPQGCTTFSGASASAGLAGQWLSSRPSDFIDVPPKGFQSVNGPYNYDGISVGEDAGLSLQGSNPTYSIYGDVLLGDGAELQLAPGDYWIGGSLTMGEQSSIVAAGASGTVRIFVQGDVSLFKDTRLNAGPDPGRLLIYAGGALTIGEGSTLHGYLYAEGEVVVNKDASVEGGIAGGTASGVGNNSIVVDEHAQVDYIPIAQVGGDFGGFCTAVPVVVSCPSVFPAALQSHSGGNIAKPNSCNVGNGCTVYGGASAITPLAAKRGSGSDGAKNIGDKTSATVGNQGDVDFTQIHAHKESHLTFSSSQSEYFITGNLKIDEKATLTLAPGDYWIDGDLTLDKEVVLNVSPATGTVRLFVQGNVDIGEKSNINSGGAAGGLLIYSGGNISIDRQADIHAYLYAENSVSLKTGARLSGGIAGDSVSLANGAGAVAEPIDQSGGDFGGFCSNPAAASSVDHYAISHDGSAVTCLAERITITAHDSADQPVDAAGATLTLSTSSGRGQWTSVVSGSGSLSGNGNYNGLASYQFASGESAVTLALSYPQLSSDPELVNLNASDGTVAEGPSEDPNLAVALSGFLFSAIPTQIAGKASDRGWNATLIELQAVRASDNDPTVCQALFNGNVAVELGAECRNPASCTLSLQAGADDGSLASAANPATAIATNNDDGGPATSAYSALTLNFSNPGARAYLALSYPDAGELQLFARRELLDKNGAPTGRYLQGSSNPFVVRPFGLAFSNIDDGAGRANPAGVAPGGAPFIAAGSPFQFDLGAYRYAAGEDLDGDGVPDSGALISDNGTTPNFNATALLSRGAITPAGGGNGVLSSGPAVLSDGQAQDLSASYNEVGSVELVATVNNYLGAADADLVANSGAVGAFYPAEWVLLPGSSVSGSCNNWTYMDQPGLSLDFVLEARNSAGLRTQHYDQALLGSGLAQVELHALNAGSATDYGSRLVAGAASWSAGSYHLSSSAASLLRDSAPDGPFDQMQLSVSLSHSLPAAVALSGASGTPASLAIGSATGFRYGRLAAENAFGPETQALPQPLRVEYFSGGRFMLDALNDCSEIPYALVTMNGAPYAAGGSVALSGGSGSSQPSFAYGLPSGSGFQLLGGKAGLSYAASGAGHMGTITLELDLSGLPWLQFDWNGDGSSDPLMRPADATFGRYRGNDRMIYWRENLTR